MTIIHEPKLLIFDEPFSGFDPINASIIRNEILELSKKGTTIIFSTHRMESVEEICSHIALINKSKTILEGPIDKIKNQFTENSYKVVLGNGMLTANNYFSIIKSEENTFHIQLEHGIKQKDALNNILTNTEIISFNKETPTMEEIFIKAVNNA